MYGVDVVWKYCINYNVFNYVMIGVMYEVLRMLYVINLQMCYFINV